MNLRLFWLITTRMYCWLPVFIAVFSSSGISATAEKISLKKKLVLINEGTASGFVKGTSVCFSAKSNEIGCGTVVKAKDDKAYVKIDDDSVIKNIKKGQDAKIASGVATAAQNQKKGAYKYAFRLLGSFFPASPAKFNTIAFNAPPSETTKVDSAWQIVEKQSSSVGGGAEFEYAFSGKSAVAVGLRTSSMCKRNGAKVFCQFATPADYVANDPSKANLYVNVTQSASDLGFWTDFYMLQLPLSKSTTFRFGTGLDFDMSTTKLIATRKDDNEKEAEFDLAVVKTSKNIISLRALPNLNMFFGGFGLNLAANLLIPLVASGSDSASVDDKLVSIVNTDASQDIIKSIGHGKSSFGMELVLGTYFAF